MTENDDSDARNRAGTDRGSGGGDGGRGARPAWAGDPPEPGSESERLLEAAAACIGRDGVLATGVASVAAEAGVSRPTVYRYFGDREALLDATLVRASVDFVARHAAHVASFSAPGDMAVESVLFMLDELLRDPVLGAFFRAELLEGNTERAFTGRAALHHAAQGLEPLRLAAGWDKQEMLEITEVLTRAVLSLFVSPEPRRTPEEIRQFLERRVLPGLGLAPGEGKRR